MFKLVSTSVSVIWLAGCAFAPQSVTIAPSIDIPNSKIGNGRDIAMNVVDERPKKTLGTVAPGNAGADISIDGDLVASVQRALQEGLTKMSFKPTAPNTDVRTELRVEIRNLDYTVIRGFWAGTLRVDAGLKGICIQDGRRPYEKLHHGEFIESIQVVQPKEANAQYINTAISAAANSLLSDKDLSSCLARGL